MAEKQKDLDIMESGSSFIDWPDTQVVARSLDLPRASFTWKVGNASARREDTCPWTRLIHLSAILTTFLLAATETDIRNERLVKHERNTMLAWVEVGRTCPHQAHLAR